MKPIFSPWSLRLVGVLLFTGMVSGREEMASHWLRDLFAGLAFSFFGFILCASRHRESLPQRPPPDQGRQATAGAGSVSDERDALSRPADD